MAEATGVVDKKPGTARKGTRYRARSHVREEVRQVLDERKSLDERTRLQVEREINAAIDARIARWARIWGLSGILAIAGALWVLYHEVPDVVAAQVAATELKITGLEEKARQSFADAQSRSELAARLFEKLETAAPKLDEALSKLKDVQTQSAELQGKLENLNQSDVATLARAAESLKENPNVLAGLIAVARSKLVASAEYSAERGDVPGEAQTDLGMADGRVCFLTGSQFEDVGNQSEKAACRVLLRNERWILEAAVRDTNDANAWCHARCVELR